MFISEYFLEIIWVGSYYLSTISIVVFLCMVLRRLFTDRKNLENLLRARKLRRLLVTQLNKPKADIRKVIQLQRGDRKILTTILMDLSTDISGKKRERLLSFFVDLGLYDAAVQQLRSFRLPKRLIAIRMLCLWSDRKTKRYLIPFLNSPNALIKATVIDTLAKMKAIELLPRILDIAENLEALSQPILTDIFTKFGEEASEEFIALAKKNSAPMRVRLAAILALGNLAPPQLVSALIPLMDDSEYEVRANILRVFERITDPRLKPVIKKGLADDSWIVRLRAIYCAKKNPSKDLLPLLENCLRDKNWLVEQRAIEAIYSVGDAKSMRTLRALAKEPSSGGKHAAALLSGEWRT